MPTLANRPWAWLVCLSGKPVSGKVVAAVEPFDLYKLSLIGGTLKLTDGIEIRAPEPTPEVLARLIAGLRRAVRDS